MTPDLLRTAAQLAHLTALDPQITRSALQSLAPGATASELWRALCPRAREVEGRFSAEEFERLAGAVMAATVPTTRRRAVELRGMFHALRSEPFPEVASSLWLFTHNLANKLLRDGHRNVFFLAREGQFLKELFDHYLELLGLRDFIRSHYLVASRRSTFIGSLDSAETETFDRLLAQYRSTSPLEFLRSLNFSAAEAESLRATVGGDFEHRHDAFADSDAFARLRSAPLFHEVFEKKRAEQRMLFNDYLSGLGVGPDQGIALVDVGWKGSIQNNIFRMRGGKANVTGYYLGITEGAFLSHLNKKIHILFSVPLATAYRQVYNEHRPLFEILLAANHGSAECYERRDGKVLVRCQWEPRERELFETVIGPFQDRIRQRFETVHRLCWETLANGDLDRDIALCHARMVFRPRRSEIAFYQSLTHYENFGVFEFARYHQPTPLFSKKMLKDLVGLARFPSRTLLRDIWPPLTLKNMNLAILIPVYGLLRGWRTFSRPLRALRNMWRDRTPPEIRDARKYLAAQQDTIDSQQKLLDERIRYRDSLLAASRERNFHSPEKGF